MWVYPPNCRTKVGARWSPSFPRQSLARRRARNIVQVHAHALNGSWECYHVIRIGLGAIWGDHGRRRSLHFTTPHFCLKKAWVYPLCPFPKKKMYPVMGGKKEKKRRKKLLGGIKGCKVFKEKSERYITSRNGWVSLKGIFRWYICSLLYYI